MSDAKKRTKPRAPSTCCALMVCCVLATSPLGAQTENRAEERPVTTQMRALGEFAGATLARMEEVASDGGLSLFRLAGEDGTAAGFALLSRGEAAG